MAFLVGGLGTTRTGDARAAITIGLAILALGQGCVSPVMFSTVLSGVPLRSAGAASGVLSTFQQVSSMLGVAVIGLVFSTALAGFGGSASPRPLAFAHAATCALSINLASMIAAALLAWRLPPATAPLSGVLE
jgi:hypothetical protein